MGGKPVERTNLHIVRPARQAWRGRQSLHEFETSGRVEGGQVTYATDTLAARVEILTVKVWGN